MRILANYGYKSNGDSYSVTFETVGDVPKEQAHDVVDDLFKMAKTAILRQIQYEKEASTVSSGAQAPVDRAEIIVPKPKQADGNGSGSTAGKPKIKDPEAPASKKQKNLIIRLAKENGEFVENLNLLTMQEASHKIDELMALSA